MGSPALGTRGALKKRGAPVDSEGCWLPQALKQVSTPPVSWGPKVSTKLGWQSGQKGRDHWP